MDTFSLEDDDARELFITQTPSGEKDGSKLVGLLGDPMDFSTPCSSVLKRDGNKSMEYSDISDDEIFDIPCSQQVAKTVDNEGRSVAIFVFKLLILRYFSI